MDGKAYRFIAASYSAALRKLVKRGWVKHINYSHITVDYNRIYEDGRIFDEKYQ